MQLNPISITTPTAELVHPVSPQKLALASIVSLIFSGIIVTSTLILATVIPFSMSIALPIVALSVSSLILMRMLFYIHSYDKGTVSFDTQKQAALPIPTSNIAPEKHQLSTISLSPYDKSTTSFDNQKQAALPIPTSKITPEGQHALSLVSLSQEVLQFLKDNQMPCDKSDCKFCQFKENDLLTVHEQLVLHAWSKGFFFIQMNEVAANIKTDIRLKQINQLAIQALAKLPPFPHQQNLTRTAYFKPNELVQIYPLGKIHILDRFMSTTSDLTQNHAPFVGNTKIVVKGITGKAVVDYSHNPNEYEVLFAPGIPFLVKEIKINTNPMEVHLEEIQSIST